MLHAVEDGWKPNRIAREIGCDPNTICNEIKRRIVSLCNGQVQRYKAEAEQKKG